MRIQSTVEKGIARMTVSTNDEDHRFEVWSEGNEAIVEYEESLSWRGVVRVGEPPEKVWKKLMQSDEMTVYLNEVGAESVRRE